ncbi:DUF2730 domain-containing protein [Shewanella sp. 3B26]|uniref:DUF2730 domain-containing protein n=1 Tax=Shewanella zhuhaiensis TaxID=2919576 RepID=A0AAJ1BJ23_9GAMM|nr:DUF2730 domain-containing protein [Shewanella zhuhaiensis]
MLDWLLKYWSVLAGIGGLLAPFVMAWFTTRFTPRIEHERVVQAVAEIEKRQRETQQQLEGIPTRDELHALDKVLHGLGERLGAMEKGINHVRNSVDMLIENEIKSERRG